MLESSYGIMSADLEVGSEDKILCSKCKNEVALPYHAYCKSCKSKYDKEYAKKFNGTYLYQIIHKDTKETIYIGSVCKSIFRRWNQHFNSKKNTPFAKWCYYNRINKGNYEMIVLDLSEYDTIDVEEILSLEHELVYRNKDIVINKDFKLPLTIFEIDTLERVYAEIDIHHLQWEPYQEVIERKKNTPTATTPESILHFELN